jgi:hypothetical protein
MSLAFGRLPSATSFTGTGSRGPRGGCDSGGWSAISWQQKWLSNDAVLQVELARRVSTLTIPASHCFASGEGGSWIVLRAWLACRAALCQTPPPISLTNVNPPSTLLAPGTTSLILSFNTPQPDTCGYSVGALLDLSQMQPVDTAGPTATHQVTVTGLNPNPQIVNPVYISCASAAGNWPLQYRAVAAPSGNFPRIGSIWGDVFTSQAAKIQLYNSLGMSSDRISALRAANPGVLILASDDATYSGPWAVFPDDYYLKDTQGNNIQVGPDGASMLNMTRPDVAEGVANYFYQQLVQSGLASDGFFLDDVFPTISWLNTDFYGNPGSDQQHGKWRSRQSRDSRRGVARRAIPRTQHPA